MGWVSLNGLGVQLGLLATLLCCPPLSFHQWTFLTWDNLGVGTICPCEFSSQKPLPYSLESGCFCTSSSPLDDIINNFWLFFFSPVPNVFLFHLNYRAMCLCLRWAAFFFDFSCVFRFFLKVLHHKLLEGKMYIKMTGLWVCTLMSLILSQLWSVLA